MQQPLEGFFSPDWGWLYLMRTQFQPRQIKLMLAKKNAINSMINIDILYY